MEFRQDGDNMGGGGGNSALMGLLAGSALNKDHDGGRSSSMMVVLAVVFFVIIFIVAIIALAMMNKDRGCDRVGGSTDVAAILTPLIAAKSMESNGCNNSNFDMLEIKSKLEESENRAVARETQQRIAEQGQSFMQLGFGLSGQIRDNEKTNLENFAKLENQMGMQSLALNQLLQKENNRDIISGVIQQLAIGAPCYAR